MINESVLLRFPVSDYTYINISFCYYNDHIVIMNEDNEDEITIEYNKDKIYNAYFIFKRNNWYVSHELRRRSVLKDPYWNPRKKTKININSYRKNIIDWVLKAFIDENNHLVILNKDKKNKFDLNALMYAVNQYIEEQEEDSLFDFDLDKLSIDLHQYYTYKNKREHAEMTQNYMDLPNFQEPIVPAPVILESLSQRFPNLTFDELIKMDMNILKLFEVIDNQKEVADFEKMHIGEKITGSKVVQF